MADLFRTVCWLHESMLFEGSESGHILCDFCCNSGYLKLVNVQAFAKKNRKVVSARCIKESGVSEAWDPFHGPCLYATTPERVHDKMPKP